MEFGCEAVFAGAGAVTVYGGGGCDRDGDEGAELARAFLIQNRSFEAFPTERPRIPFVIEGAIEGQPCRRRQVRPALLAERKHAAAGAWDLGRVAFAEMP